MREIKFRSINSQTKRVHYAFIKSTDYICDFVEVFRNGELNQYTGLKDKNGKEIYEGDIVNCSVVMGLNNIKLGSTILKVEFIEGEFVPNYKYRFKQPLINDMQIIGNIYENPELLKDTKDVD